MGIASTLIAGIGGLVYQSPCPRGTIRLHVQAKQWQWDENKYCKHQISIHWQMFYVDKRYLGSVVNSDRHNTCSGRLWKGWCTIQRDECYPGQWLPLIPTSREPSWGTLLWTRWENGVCNWTCNISTVWDSCNTQETTTDHRCWMGWYSVEIKN